MFSFSFSYRYLEMNQSLMELSWNYFYRVKLTISPTQWHTFLNPQGEVLPEMDIDSSCKGSGGVPIWCKSHITFIAKCFLTLQLLLIHSKCALYIILIWNIVFVVCVDVCLNFSFYLERSQSLFYFVPQVILTDKQAHFKISAKGGFFLVVFYY